MKAIPAFLLPHAALLKKPARDSVWGNNGTSDTMLLSKIRVELKNARKASKTVEATAASGTLFYDCHNSLPRNAVFEVGDLVEFQGYEYAVTAVEWFCGRSAEPHHAELTLS